MVRPEPTNRRPRKRWPNEEHPLTLRIGAIRDELDARTNGTTRAYRQVIMRDLQRYYSLIQYNLFHINEKDAREAYIITTSHRPAESLRDDIAQWWAQEFSTSEPLDDNFITAIIDACERAHILVQHAGLSVDEALIAVGLVREKE